jgi:uncharacterized protein
MFRRKKGNAFGVIIAVFLAIVIISLIINNPKTNSNLDKSKLKIPAAVGFVNDFAGVISSGNKNNLESYLKELDAKTGAEIAVVTLASLKGNSVEDVALNIGRKWGVGKKGKDNGVVILVATGDKKMRIEVGYGLEGIIPDGKAGRIRDDYMIPFFKQGNMEQGIINGTIAVASEISKAYKVEMPAEFNSSAANLTAVSSYSSQTDSVKASPVSDFFGYLIFIIFFIIIYRNRTYIGGYSDYGSGFGGSSGGSGFDFGGFGGGDFGGGGASGGW